MKVKQIIVTEKTQELEITRATLLSIEEAKQLPLELRKYTSRWWLRSSGYDSYHAANVGYAGVVDNDGVCVPKDCFWVRPALQISNLNSSNLNVGDKFEFDGKPFKIISDNFAFCLTDIGRHCFREDWRANNANDYEKSDIKKYIDDWFEKACRE